MHGSKGPFTSQGNHASAAQGAQEQEEAHQRCRENGGGSLDGRVQTSIPGGPKGPDPVTLLVPPTYQPPSLQLTTAQTTT